MSEVIDDMPRPLSPGKRRLLLGLALATAAAVVMGGFFLVRLALRAAGFWPDRPPHRPIRQCRRAVRP